MIKEKVIKQSDYKYVNMKKWLHEMINRNGMYNQNVITIHDNKVNTEINQKYVKASKKVKKWKR
jgi:hypothetical protein